MNNFLFFFLALPEYNYFFFLIHRSISELVKDKFPSFRTTKSTTITKCNVFICRDVETYLSTISRTVLGFPPSRFLFSPVHLFSSYPYTTCYNTNCHLKSHAKRWRAILSIIISERNHSSLDV